MIKATAIDQGLDPVVAMDTLIPDNAATKGTAMAYVAGEAAFGAGTLATMGKASFVANEMGDERKKLSRAEQEALPGSYTHLRAHQTVLDIVCRLLLEKKNKNNT